ncbi:14921_t:CDS:1, partial [Racocetra fulgida]
GIEAIAVTAAAIYLKKLYNAITEALRPGKASIKYVDIQLNIINAPNPTTIEQKIFFLKFRSTK